ncbi:PREDICTED: transcriptional repressor CTCF-like isoform X4 [Dinoponera quadriceps]|uniref:Transcriptional repressor CTCF-like isoform X4 n=1 Tax=Dinoponera quadriceps TaxID=609295 RepID=A0A6P3XTB0_DINQU|nr:PREDICTED: transcriptional repressor CTCF-like isoform X4 [Dinoponera quadriceps]
MTTNVATIKLEEGQESVTEIQTYLETFNKEIEGGQGEQLQHVQLQQVEGLSGGEEGGTYFVDQSGQYYYQANSDETPVMTQVQIQEVEETDVQNEGDVAQDEQYHEIEELENVEGEEETQTSNNENNQVVINSGDAYQTVTIVPSDTNPGEVSYVLIVQQPETEEKEVRPVESEAADGEEAEGEQDLTVYDFEDNEDNEVPVESEAEDDKAKVMKFLPKKSQTVTQAHMCNYCNYTSPKRYLLSRHMKSHSEERPHKCSVCERGFKTLASLQNHVNTHTGTKPHHCKYCDSAFTTSGELVRHVRYRHTHEKPHKCHECDYASVELSKLKRHIRCHTGERPYQCPHCTYASPDTFKLKRHLRIHTGEKPYECDLCPARFTQSNSLKAHKLIHNVGDKPVFQCELCPATCGRKTDLRIHVQKLHTSDKPLKCKRCGKTFPDRHKGNLIRHMAVHDPESSLQEKQQALKIGRQKKIQIIDGQRVEVMTGDSKLKGYEDEEEEEDEEDAMMAVQGSDGQQYVVLEVIQLADNQGTDQMAVVASEDGELVMQDPLSQESSIVTATGEEVDEVEEEDIEIQDMKIETVTSKSSTQSDPKLQKEMETCFGFDEEEEEEEDEGGSNINMLQTIS